MKTSECGNQTFRICFIIPGVDDQIEMQVFETVAQIMPVTLDEMNAQRLGPCVPVDDGNIMALFYKIFRHISACKNGSASDKYLHCEPPNRSACVKEIENGKFLVFIHHYTLAVFSIHLWANLAQND